MSAIDAAKLSTSGMGALMSADVRHFRHRLYARREALSREETPRHGDAAVNRDVHDAGDESVAALLRDVDVSGRERELQELKDIDAALARIAAGDFGVCRDCGDPIPRDRLEVYPTAKRCLRCQQLHEKRRTGGADASPSL